MYSCDDIVKIEETYKFKKSDHVDKLVILSIDIKNNWIYTVLFDQEGEDVILKSTKERIEFTDR